MYRFLSTLSLRRATGSPDHRAADPRDFYPRSPCGERPYYMQWDITDTVISIHALLAESDGTIDLTDFNKTVFLSTLSLRRATGLDVTIIGRTWISIHALLAESDITVGAGTMTLPNFYPRSPCGERLTYVVMTPGNAKFLSTLSLRRATSYSQHVKRPSGYFYPRSPCGERQRNHLFSRWICYFYPRSPCGERPRIHSTSSVRPDISIHALLAESDTLRQPLTLTLKIFLSTLSLRRATRDGKPNVRNSLFLSTLSLRRAT